MPSLATGLTSLLVQFAGLPYVPPARRAGHFLRDEELGAKGESHTN